MMWALPTRLEVGGREYAINADYRVILEIISRLSAADQDDDIKGYVCLALFYPDFDKIPGRDYKEAFEKLYWFISCGDDEADDQKHPKVIDWEQDYQLIVSDINKVAGHDVRGDEFCHWWTFTSYFMGIGEGQLSTVVAIREKLRKGKRLEKWEHEYYKKNRSRVDLKRHYTGAEDDLVKLWTGR